MPPYQIVVSDSSVILDLAKTRLIEATLALPFAFVIPDVILDQELLDLGTYSVADLVRRFQNRYTGRQGDRSGNGALWPQCIEAKLQRLCCSDLRRATRLYPHDRRRTVANAGCQAQGRSARISLGSHTHCRAADLSDGSADCSPAAAPS